MPLFDTEKEISLVCFHFEKASPPLSRSPSLGPWNVLLMWAFLLPSQRGRGRSVGLTRGPVPRTLLPNMCVTPAPCHTILSPMATCHLATNILAPLG